MLEAIIRRLDNLLVFFSGVIIMLMLILTTVSVIGRYFFNMPVPNNLAITELLLVMVVYLPMAYVQRHGGHVFVTLFTDWLPPRIRKKFDVLGMTVGTIFIGTAAWATFTDSYAAYTVGAYMEGTLELPEWPFRFAISLGLALFCLRLIMEILSVTGVTALPKKGGTA